MQVQIPHFKYSISTDPINPVLSIEADGKVIHEEACSDEFYKAFGYNQQLKNAGVLPEEFISKEYIKDNEINYYLACMQMHIIDYLKNYSEPFKASYADQCDNWISGYAEIVATRGEKCASCRMMPYCIKLKPESV